jgi:hypothetical protein
MVGGSGVDVALLEPDRTLRSRFELLVENADEPVRSEARHHLAYCDQLEMAREMARP